MEQTNTGAAMPAKRPTFLTVLCIISFVGIAISLIGGIMSYFTYSAMASAGDMMGGLGAEGAQVGAAMDMLGMDPSKMATNALVVSLMNIPILIGVLMMWKQKKTGFFIYAACELVQAIVPFIIVGGAMGGLSGIITTIFAIIFIVLYGLNMKHMS